jgi:hypothetical protein
MYIESLRYERGLHRKRNIGIRHRQGFQSISSESAGW